MSTTMGNQVTADSVAIRQAQRRCTARGRPRSMRKASAARSVRKGAAPRAGSASAGATPGGSATVVWGVPTTTDVALEVRIAGITAALREAQQKRATLLRDWKIGQLQLALIAAVRMRSAAQIVRLTMWIDAVVVAAGPGGATGTEGQS